MLRQGGAIIINGVALQSCLRAGAGTAASGCPSPLSGSAATLTLPHLACCAAARTGTCQCFNSSRQAHAPGCSCSACPAAPSSTRGGALPAAWRTATPQPSEPASRAAPSHTLAGGWPGAAPPSASISTSFPFALRALHTSAAASTAATPARSAAQAAAAVAAADADADAERGRRSRRPQAAEDSAPGGRTGHGSGGLPGDGEDAELQTVLSKLVGGLTRSGRKARARRIVEGALDAMRRHLKRGGVEELK